MKLGLTITTLGDLTFQQDGETITGFPSRKVEALLIYLAVESKTAHRRENLYSLLWPGMPEKSARHNLRQVLYALRQTFPQVAALVGDDKVSLLLADRQTVQICSDAAVIVDIHRLDSLTRGTKQHNHTNLATCPGCQSALEEAIALYQGDFLENFYLPDSNLFEEWAEANRASYRQKKLDTLNTLAAISIQRRDYERACGYIDAQLEIDNLQETAHRQMMELLALSGQRVEAIRQYHELARILNEELGITPSKETIQLYQRIQSEDLLLEHTVSEVKTVDPQLMIVDGRQGEMAFFDSTFKERYQIRSEIGQGGMGSVYRAHDNALDRDVALKILTNPDLGAEGRLRLLKEAQMVAKLNHPNIVTVYDVGETDLEGLQDLPGLVPFIVMEYVEGTNLYQQPPKQIEDIIPIAQQICAALEHAHTHGIIHRDLKPENIILTSDGTAKLMDFGLARSMASRLSSEGKIAGTVFYLAPEQALGQMIDQRSDLYALGVLLYELTTGEPPFQADDPVAVISQHLHAPVIPPRVKNPEIPPGVENLIIRLLQKNPADRPAAARDVRQLLENPTILIDEEELPAKYTFLDRIVRGKMIGRKAEMQHAQALWNKTLAGEGQTVLVSGEAGIGKTRLMREMVAQVIVSGGRAFVGGCYSEGNSPYAAFRRIIQDGFRQNPDLQESLPEFVMAELIALTPSLKVIYPDIPQNTALEPQAQQQRLRESVVIFCQSLSKRNPLLIVVEDLHWSDGGSLALFQVLSRRTRHDRIMLLGTYREVELDKAHTFNQVLVDLNRERLASRMKLSRLSREQTGEMLTTLFVEEISPEFLEGIYHETEGNPFFVEEICKTLIESGKLYFEDGKWQHPSMEKLEIPQSLRVTIQSRVENLAQDVQESLTLAAILGREFVFNTLAAISELAEDILIDSLEQAERAQMIEEASSEAGGTFMFSHGLIPAILRNSLSGLRRRRLHHKAAQVIEQQNPEMYAALAYHYSQACINEKALTYLIKAGDQASERYANEDAILYYTQALEILGAENLKERFDLLSNRVAIYDLMAQRETQLADIEAMLRLADELQDPARQVDALLALAKLYIEIDHPKAREPAEQSYKLSQEAGDTQREARALSILGWQYRYSGDYHIACQHLENAIELTRQKGATPDLVEFLNQLSYILIIYLGDFNTGFATIQEAIDLSREIEDKRAEVKATWLLARAYEERNEFATALPVAEVALQNAREIGDVDNMLGALNTLGLIKQGLGRFEEAESDFLEITNLPDIFASRYTAFVVRNLSTLYMAMGEYEKYLRLINNLLKKAYQAENELWIYSFRQYYATAFEHLGKFRDALETSKANWAYAEKALDQKNQVVDLTAMGIYAAEAGDFELAYQYLEASQQRFDNLEEAPFRVNVLSNSAIVALLDGRPEALKLGLEQLKQGMALQEKYSNQQFSGDFFCLARFHIELHVEDSAHAAEALSSLEKALNLFKHKPDPYLHPEELYFLASRVYRANDHIEEADDYLRQAYERVKLVAGKIQDDDLRQSYLENVPDNRVIMAQYQERLAEQP